MMYKPDCYLQNVSNQSTFLIEKASNNTRSGGICFTKVCLLSHIN